MGAQGAVRASSGSTVDVSLVSVLDAVGAAHTSPTDTAVAGAICIGHAQLAVQALVAWVCRHRVAAAIHIRLVSVLQAVGAVVA